MLAGKVRSGTKVPKTELMMMTSQLAIMTRTGVDLADALKNLAGQCRHPALKKTLADVYDRVSGGQTVSSAGAARPRFRPGLCRRHCRGGSLRFVDRSAHPARAIAQKRNPPQKHLWSIMAYPLVLFAVAGIVVCAYCCLSCRSFPMCSATWATRLLP